MEEINSSTPTHSGIQHALSPIWHPAKSKNSGSSKGRLSRKDDRKLGRLEGKQRKAQHNASKKRQQNKRSTQEEHKDTPVAKKLRVCAPSPGAEGSNSNGKGKTALRKLAGDSEGYPSLPRIREEDKEDAYIRYLEGKLGWKKDGTKTTTYGSGLVDDGLDGISTPFTVVLASPFKTLSTELLADLDNLESSLV